VRPMPPTVARKSSGSPRRAPHVTTRPSATRMRSARTWCAEATLRVVVSCRARPRRPCRPGSRTGAGRDGHEPRCAERKRRFSSSSESPPRRAAPRCSGRRTEDAVRERGVETRAVGRPPAASCRRSCARGRARAGATRGEPSRERGEPGGQSRSRPSRVTVTGQWSETCASQGSSRETRQRARPQGPPTAPRALGGSSSVEAETTI
jgi:hypothetical protein